MRIVLAVFAFLGVQLVIGAIGSYFYLPPSATGVVSLGLGGVVIWFVLHDGSQREMPPDLDAFEGLTSPDPEIRDAAVTIIGSLPPADVTQEMANLLVSLRSDLDRRVRARAKWAIQKQAPARPDIFHSA